LQFAKRFMQKTRLDGGFFDRTPDRDMTPYLSGY